MDFGTVHNEASDNDDSWPLIGAEYQYFDPSMKRYQYTKPDVHEAEGNTQIIARQSETQRILINPNFNKKVFVNPNFNPQTKLPQHVTRSVIHVNTKIYNPKFLQTNFNQELHQTSAIPALPTNINQKIHVNPTVIMKNAKYLNDTLQKQLIESEYQLSNEKLEPESGTKCSNRTTPQRHVFKSKYSIVKSTSPTKRKYKSPSLDSGSVRKRRYSVKTMYKVVRSSPTAKKAVKRKPVQSAYKIVKNITDKKDIYKLDNTVRRRSYSAANRKKFVYVNKFLSLGDMAKHTVIKKNPNLKMSVTNVKIGDLTYKKSPHSLKRTFSKESGIATPVKLGVKDSTKSSKYKLVRRRNIAKLENEKIENMITKKARKLSEKSFSVRKFKIIRRERRSVSPKKMKKCNIPCSFFKKYGICKANEKGKCSRKHDPDQIALCTKFLQGACIKENCRLSHRVLPEKMPTCKYYLEGSCSKDNCPYLHVKISPKADICRDFIEGFCANAAKCDKRHQYLCPDFEKYGKCPKQRCEYPHGIMVRNYYFENRSKFVKKHSNINKDKTRKIFPNVKAEKSDGIEMNTSEIEVTIDLKSRYYEENHLSESSVSETAAKDFRSRPKLGELPAFIPFS